MKKIYKLLMFGAILVAGINISTNAQTVYYVADSGGSNWDIYSFYIMSGIETRRTTHPAIDNHPSISDADTSRIVFSSNRDGGEFDIYVADVNDIDNTAVRLTFNNDHPDRHPHWHPNGELIIFTSKDRPVTVTVITRQVTECSQPIIIVGYSTRYYEGLNIVDPSKPGIITPLDITTAWDQTNDPDIWILGDSTYVGHPSFNHQGDLIVFSAAIDGEGKNWEIYTVGFDPDNISLIPNSLKRITHGPNWGSNPLKMSGGAEFSKDDSEIIFNYTRTTGGNSQIFSVPASSKNLEMDNSYRRTWHHGNDYVPEPLDNGDILVTSDLGDLTICQCDTTIPGATKDLDVVLLENWSTRTVLGSDSLQETLLLADEVSWFCGLKPNLSQCTYQVRIMNVESLWLESNSFELLPPDLLAGYGDAYAENAKEMYATAWNNLQNEMMLENPDLLNQLIEDMGKLWVGFPGWDDSDLLGEWLDSTAQIRRKKYVVPTIMYGFGLGDSCVFITDTLTGISENLSEQPFELKQNSPNPFKQFTTVNYELSRTELVRLTVYDVIGKHIATLVNKVQPKGSYTITFDSGDLPEGIYFCSMQVNNSFQIKKMVLIKQP